MKQKPNQVWETWEPMTFQPEIKNLLKELKLIVLAGILEILISFTNGKPTTTQTLQIGMC